MAVLSASALALLAAATAAAPRGAGAGPRPERPERPFAPLAQPAPAPPVAPAQVEARPQRAPRSGTVSGVAGGRAYLDAGARDGIAVGQRLELARGGRPAASCTVDAVADRSATCVGTGLRAGDTFALAAPPSPAAPPPPRLSPVPDPDELGRRRSAVEAAAVRKVEYLPPPRQESVRELSRVEASLVHASWFSSGAGALHQERLEARVRGTELVPGWRLFLDASAVYRPVGADDARFRPGSSAYLEVRELQAASRELDRPYTIAIGRVLPWSAPGSTAFDGAQVGWRGRAGEIGAFGGIVPDVLTTDPTTSRATAGVYGAVERGGRENLLRAEGRVAMVRSPELGTRLEAEALAHAWLSRSVDLSGQARLGFGDRTAPAALDSARVDLTARVAEPLWVTGSFRYVGLLVTDVAAPALFPSPARHADLTAAWDVARGLTIRGIGGYATDLGNGLDRGYFGPEIALPRLFGRGGLSAGWLEERGWASGRNVWLQASGEGVWGLRLLARASLFVDQRPAPLSDDTTLGLVGSASRDLTTWLRFRVWASGRIGLGHGEATGPPGGVSFLAALDGLY